MTGREVFPPGERYAGEGRVFARARRQWEQLCRSRPNAMRQCYAELADNPFPPGQLARHHRLKGKLRDHWEYEVGGGERVRYKRGPNGEPVVTYAGPAPADTH